LKYNTINCTDTNEEYFLPLRNAWKDEEGGDGGPKMKKKNKEKHI